MEWIDKLFNCMAEFYGERWTKPLQRPNMESIEKTRWQSALQGLTYEQIRGALVFLKRAAQSNSAMPPNFLEFFRYAKGEAKIHINYEGNARRGDPAVARRAMDEITAKLRGGSTLKQG